LGSKRLKSHLSAIAFANKFCDLKKSFAERRIEKVRYLQMLLSYKAIAEKVKSEALLDKNLPRGLRNVAPRMGFEPMRTLRSTGSQGPRVNHSAISAHLFHLSYCALS
jgi:hypothetical protein